MEDSVVNALWVTMATPTVTDANVTSGDRYRERMEALDVTIMVSVCVNRWCSVRSVTNVRLPHLDWQRSIRTDARDVSVLGDHRIASRVNFLGVRFDFRDHGISVSSMW